MDNAFPIVAILGRPNVGKSTLFNRLTGTRRAIAESTAGVTRDRLYGLVDWDGKHFELIDTGGVEEAGKDALKSSMQEQTENALEEADAVIVLLDGAAGLHPVDREIINRARALEVKIFFVVNKIDSAKREDLVFEFYEAGVDKMYPVSAEHGRGIGELLDALVADLPLTATAMGPEATNISIAIVGRPNAGKSSLVNRLLGEDRVVVSEVAGTTRDAIDTILKVDGQTYTLVDTAGIRKKARVTETLEKFSVGKALEAVRRCDVAVLVIDATVGIHEQEAKIASETQDAWRAAVVVVNKWDARPEGVTRATFAERLRTMLRFATYAKIVFVSAKTGEGVRDILPTVKQAYTSATTRIGTAEVNRVLMETVQRVSPPAPGGRTVRIRFGTQISTNPPTFAIVSNRPEDVGDSYRRFLVNTLREHFVFEGAPIRLAMRRAKGRWKAADRFTKQEAKKEAKRDAKREAV